MTATDICDSAKEIKIHLDAGFPLIYLVSWEEERVCEHLALLCKEHLEPARAFVTWSLTEGFSDIPGSLEKPAGKPLAALTRVLASKTPALFVFKDFHPFIKEDREIVRRLRDVYNTMKNTQSALLILSPILEVPPELVKDVVVLDYGLPLLEEVNQIVENEIWSHYQQKGRKVEFADQDRVSFLRMLLGLTREEMRRTLRKLFAITTRIAWEHTAVINEEKRQILRKTEILEFIEPQEDMSTVGGLGRFKNWCAIRKEGLTQEARDFGLPLPKGVLITGISGCGKSLAIIALAKEWHLPLLRLDMGRVFTGMAGTPEQSLRRAILTAEAVAPSVLWIDEIEMGISVFSDSVESGSTSRIFATFLTWMQEKTAPVFIAATANDIDRLPPEFIRKGRFDEVFFVDLPEEDERAEIFRIHLIKRKQEPTETNVLGLAKASKGFTGAEIEHALVSALYEAFSESRRLTMNDIYRNISRMVPLAVTMKEQLTKTRRWADNRAVRANN